MRIGSVWYNTVAKQVASFAEQDTVLKQLGFDPSVNSRWLSVDPLASEYPSLSPYNYVDNNPIIATDPDGRTIYYVNGEEVYNDGSDNGLVVHTTQDIIDDFTEDGETNWDEVRNSEDSNVEIENNDKYVAWKGEVLSSLDEAGFSGSIDNEGNIDVRSVDTEIQNLYVNMILSFGLGRAISGFRSFGLFFKEKGDKTQFHSNLNYSTVKSILKKIGGKTKKVPGRGEVTTVIKNGAKISVRNFSNQGDKTLEIISRTGKQTKIRLKN